MSRPKFVTGPVRVHFVEYESKGYSIEARCNCGWVGRHRRPKVLEAKVDRHLEANGGGVKPL